MLLFYWLLYSAITETRSCDLGLIALLLLGLMYGKLNHYVIIGLIVWVAEIIMFHIQQIH